MYRLSSLATAMFLVGVQPASADMILTLQMPAEKVDVKTGTILSVDRHDVLLLDVSDSMDDEDINALLNGVISHYSSDDAIADYRAGICTANTVVFYADAPQAVSISIICNEDDLSKFVEEIGSIELADVRSHLGAGTNLVDAMNAALVVFDEERVHGISSGLRSVVIVGDQIGGELQDLKDLSSALTMRHEATVSAISIRAPFLTGVFRNSVRTDEDTAKAYSIRTGVTGGASTPEDVGTILQTVLAFQRG